MELADAPDSKSGDGDIVRVQVPPSAPVIERLSIESLSFCGAKSGITEIVTLAQDATRLLAIPSLRSLQVPPSAPPKHTQKERYEF